MNTINKKFPGTPKALALVITALLASPLAVAADDGWYLGASAGQSRADLNFGVATTTGLPTGVTIINPDYDDRDTGFKLFGGYQLNNNFAFEGGRFDLGNFGFTANTIPTGTSSGDYDVDGWFLDMVGTIPLTSKIDFLARAGFTHAYTTSHMYGTGAVPAVRPTDRGSDSNPKLGLGLQYELTDNLDVRLEAERFHLDEPFANKGDVDLLSLGVVYRFGSKPVRQPAPAAPVARATPPAAAPAPAPTPPPAPTRVVFSADSLFDFDQSIIKDAGKQNLDRFIANLNGASYESILVTGHTDRIGARDYNLALSQRRADAVKNYLVQSGNLPAAKITSRGVNGDDPVVGPNECKNTAGNAAVILCLQPDRRVEVEVNATKP